MALHIKIIPNYALVSEGDDYYLEPSHPLIIKPLIENGLTVTIAAPIDMAENAVENGTISKCFSNEIKISSIGNVYPHQSYFKRAINYIRLLFPIMKNVKKADFLYIFYPGHIGFISVICCWIIKKPYALYLRGDVSAAMPLLLQKMSSLIYEKAVFTIITGDQLTKKMLIKGYRAISVVPMSPLLWMENIHVRNHSVDGRISLLFVGQMIRDKGIYDLLYVMSRLKQKNNNINVSLTFVGAGADAEPCKKYAKELGIQGYVKFEGLIVSPLELAEKYKYTDIFVLPSFFPEGFPRVLWEAMAFSIPIVTTTVGQISTVMIDGYNAVLCEPRSVDALEQAISKLINEPEFAKKIGENAQKTWESEKARCKNLHSHGDQIVQQLIEYGFMISPDN